MAALGGMLAAAILKVVGDQIGEAIGGQIKLQKNFDKDLKKMKMALESVADVLEDAERRSITDRSTLLWLKRLKDAMYAISDTIDEFEADTEVISQPSARKFCLKQYLDIMIPCLTVGPKIIVANKMENMRQNLEVITDQRKKFQLVEGTNTNEPKITNIRETSSRLERHIIGRDKDKDDILSSLYGTMTEAITILPIYGIAGLGKTTLAKMVFNSPQFKEYSQVWVYVSQTFDLKNICNSIISQLSDEGEEREYIGMQMMHNSLKMLLADKKIIIVLDDLWEGEEFHLESLMDMLMVGKGSNVVVVVTTRDEGIASKISTIQPYKLAPLSDDMCWSIIKQTCKFESRSDKEQLENIGKVIAMKCGGIALAAKSLGHMLQSMKPSEWESVRDSNIWTASSLRDTSSSQVLASLKLSYSVMPSHLKLCFAYCAIFPKGHKIVKDDLIHQWVSLGFSTRQLGERYISQLLGLSFLEHSKSTLTIEMDDENITLLTMHDLVHDLARSVMDDEILVIGKGGNEEIYYHYALLDDCSKPLGLESSKIRALRFVECDKIELRDAAFSSAKSLRVLDLSECIIHNLSDCIGELRQLRYLNTPRVQDVAIPDSITKLSKLTYLNLHGSPTILALPESIGEIEGLTYLDLSGCSEIKKFPESFGMLKELVHLNLSGCYSVGGISVFLGSLTQLQYLNLSCCPNIGKLPEALGGLSKLQYLNLSFSSYIEGCDEAEVLGALTKLEYLNLSSYSSGIRELPETLGRFTQLKYLNISGCRWMTELPRVFGLACLQYLNLAITRIFSLPDGLTKLKYLNISWSRAEISDDTFDSLLKHICTNLSDLEHLDLSHNINLTSIPESICSLTKLHTLDLSGCYRLYKIPSSVFHPLKFLYLRDLHFVVQPDHSDSGSNLVQLQPIDTHGLRITELENVKSVREAHYIKLLEKEKLKELTLEWTGDVDRFVDDRMLLENLVPPSTLKDLEICGYNGVSFPSWLVDQLPKLRSVVLRDMANLEQWDTSSYSSGDDHVIERLEIHDCPILRMKPLPPRASIWKISNSDNVLSSWEECSASHTNASSSSSPVTTELSVYRSKVPLYQWTLLQHLRGLSYLTVDNCGDLTYVKTLCLQDKDQAKVPKLIGDLTSLQYLVIRGCRGLEGLNKNMGRLRKLKTLQLCYCNNLASLPHWLDKLTSLMQLVILRCDVLRSLPESIQQLSSLQALEISFCPKLKHVVESEEGKMKLTHNKERVCLLPVSLETLAIVYCEGIKSLPEGIQQLTNLQTIKIESCPELEQWCDLEENRMKLAHIEIKH